MVGWLGVISPLLVDDAIGILCRFYDSLPLTVVESDGYSCTVAVGDKAQITCGYLFREVFYDVAQYTAYANNGVFVALRSSSYVRCLR